MASWMVHLRVADRLLSRLERVAQTEFIVGNIAPDSGVPNQDWTAYTPSTKVSHFKSYLENGTVGIDIESYVRQYFTPEKRAGYSREQYSFYLGYLTHLLTDLQWIDRVYQPSIARYPEAFAEDSHKLLWTLKKDWYDLDFLYLQKHPDFRAFQIYESAVGFANRYMDIFAEDAFENRREYITGFYRGGREGLEREYVYLTEAQAEQFVEDCVNALCERLEQEFQISISASAQSDAFVILVTGIPASGKSVLAEKLSARLRLPWFSKDSIKEELYDTIGFASREEKVELGRAGTEILYYVAEQMMRVRIPFILENNFETESGSGLMKLLKRYGYRALTLRLSGDYARVYERFAQRDKSPMRHPGHVTNNRYYKQEGAVQSQTISLEQYIEGVRSRGMDSFSVGSQVITVDTTDFSKVNWDALYREIDCYIKAASQPSPSLSL